MGGIVEMDENEIKLKEIVTGKPDASDEVTSLCGGNIEEYMKLYIDPPTNPIGSILKRGKYLVVGNKGIGKTGLLFALKHRIQEKHPDAVWSIILFKKEYTQIKKAQLSNIQARLLSIIDIPNPYGAYSPEQPEFIMQWELALLTKVVHDNVDDDTDKYRIFENDNNWQQFEKIVAQLNCCLDSTPKPRLVEAIPKYDDTTHLLSAEPIDYPEEEDSIQLMHFSRYLDHAKKLFATLTRTGRYYMLCIDELEAFGNSNKDNFCRDLTLIRDLIRASKGIHDIILSSNYLNTKIVISLRQEILNSIEQNIPTEEINKCIDGFEVRIDWNSNLKTAGNPLFLIWLSRIKNSIDRYIDKDVAVVADQLFTSCFPPKIGNEETINYFLSRSWLRPRDIIRFMLCLEDKLEPSDTSYSLRTIHNASTLYSAKSLGEIREEMSAHFSPTENQQIIDALTNFKKKFTRAQFEERLKSFSSSYSVASVLAILYRVGIIGTLLSDDSERWAHKNKEYLFNDQTEYIVHRALWYELALQTENIKGILAEEILGEYVDCKILRYNPSTHLYNLTFTRNGKKEQGVVHVRLIDKSYTEVPVSKVGTSIGLYIVDYSSRHNEWVLSHNPESII